MKTMKSFLNVLLFFSIVMFNPVTAQTPGEIDFSFDPQAGITGFENYISSIELQPDGKIIIGGRFTSYNNIPRSRIARVNTDGTLDTSFDPGTGFDNTVRDISLLPDGKILVVGDFTTYNEISVGRIARLNPDGSLDTSFVSGAGFDDRVWVVTLQADGNILVGGNFSSYDGMDKNKLARLDPNGNLEAEFNNGVGPTSNRSIRDIVELPDGKILIGGTFNSYNNIPNSGKIARLNPIGTLDVTFSSSITSDVYRLVLQPDEKILVGGRFAGNIARLNPDGTADSTFDPGTGTSGGNSVTERLTSLVLQQDGKILIGGNFTSYNGTDINRIAYLNSDGSLNTSFDPGTGFETNNDRVYALVIQPDGKVLVGGEFTNYDGIHRPRIARIYGTDLFLGIEDNTVNENNWFIIKENGLLQVESKGFEMDEIAVYDLMGRELYKTTNLYTTQHKLPAFSSNQILIVRVVSDTGKQMHKKVVN